MISKTFYKEQDGRWYIDLPEYIEQGGTKEELEMVLGADTFLDMISEGEEKINVSFSEQIFDNFAFTLEKKEQDEYGATYYISSFFEQNFDLWLCPVTKFVFGGYYPQTLYVR